MERIADVWRYPKNPKCSRALRRQMSELEGETDLPRSAPTEKSGKDMGQTLKDFGTPGNEP
jgi:hypothetical protein